MVQLGLGLALAVVGTAPGARFGGTGGACGSRTRRRGRAPGSRAQGRRPRPQVGGLLLLREQRRLAFDDRIRQLAKINSIERMLSSLPGIGKSTVSGSLSVSISATVVMPMRWASLTAICSRFGSTTTMASGRRFISRMPCKLRRILRQLPIERGDHLLAIGADLRVFGGLAIELAGFIDHRPHIGDDFTLGPLLAGRQPHVLRALEGV